MQNSDLNMEQPRKIAWSEIFGILCLVQFIAIGYLISKLPDSRVAILSPTPLVVNEPVDAGNDFRTEVKKINNKTYCLEKNLTTGETTRIGEILANNDCQYSDGSTLSIFKSFAPIHVSDYWVDDENLAMHFLSYGPSSDEGAGEGKYILTSAQYQKDVGINYTVQSLPFGGVYTGGSIVGARGDILVLVTGGGDGCGGGSSYFTYSVSKKIKVKDIISYSYDCDSVKFTNKVGMKDNLIWFIDSEFREGRDGPITFTTLFNIDPFTGNRKTIITNFSQAFPNLYIAEAVPPEISSQLHENEVAVTDFATRGQQNANWSAVDVQTKNIRKLQ